MSASTSASPAPLPSAQGEKTGWERYLAGSAVPRPIIDTFLNTPCWAKFDPELGYTLQNNVTPFGMQGIATLETFGPTGARSSFMYPGRKPRINSYGDSFTECSQVNDGETWQEYLAAHFCEPIGNYGVGGYGVYQAYRRMIREEVKEQGAETVILYIWGDDATRSLMRSRWPVIYPWFAPVAEQHKLFHANFWSNIELDISTGQLVEQPNRLDTPERLYLMCDPDWMVANVRDDAAAHLSAFIGAPQWGMPGLINELDWRLIGPLSDALQVSWDASNPLASATRLLNVYAQRATIQILNQARTFARLHKKRLLIVLNATARAGDAAVAGQRNDDQILAHLQQAGFDYFDMNDVHDKEHARTTVSFAEYMDQYLVGGAGHYNPRGNHLFAYSIKDKLLSMLDPKPLPYLEHGRAEIDFRGYLPGYH